MRLATAPDLGPRTGLARVCADVGGVLAVVSAVIGATLLAVVAHRAAPGDDGSLEQSLQDGSFIGARLISAVLFSVGGWYLSRRHPRGRLGPISLMAGIGDGVALLGGGWAMFSEVGSHDLTGAAAGVWLTSLFSLEPMAVVAIYLLYPDARFARGILGRLSTGIFCVTVGGIGAGLLSPTPIDPDGPLQRLGSSVGLHVLPEIDGFLLFAPAIAAATIVVLLRWRQSLDEQRLWMRPMGAVALLGILVTPLVALPLGSLVAEVHTLILLLVVIHGAARHHAYGVEAAINRALVYAVLSATLAVAYSLLTVAAVDITGLSAGLAGSTGAIGVALLLAPARDRAQHLVNRVLYGERDDPIEVMSRVAEQLESVGSVEDLLPGLVKTIARTLHVPYVAIDLATGDDDVRIEFGESTGPVDSFPLLHHATDIGMLLVGHRSGEHRRSTDETRLLNDLARQSAAAASSYALSLELRRSREQVLVTSEEERRRLSRELHDGLGPALIAATSRVDASRNVIGADPNRADALLAEIRTDLDTALGEVRRLIHVLRPPALDEVGLVQALTAAANRANIKTTFDVPKALPPIPPAVELTAYRIVTEAITNVVRHADASRCHVTIRADARLVIDVCDDGVASGPWLAGMGLTSIGERATELGGRWTAGPTDNGGHVHVELPLRLAEFDPR